MPRPPEGTCCTPLVPHVSPVADPMMTGIMPGAGQFGAAGICG